MERGHPGEAERVGVPSFPHATSGPSLIRFLLVIPAAPAVVVGDEAAPAAREEVVWGLASAFGFRAESLRTYDSSM